MPQPCTGEPAAITIDAFACHLQSYLSTEQINLVRRAYYYAEQAHDGQTRLSGEPYIKHPLAVASILADLHMDHYSLMAAMLHDVIEDTGIGKQAIKTQFGDVVAELVDGVSKLTHMSFEDRTRAQAENFRKMALAMARDIRVILVKLADRLHNMRTLAVLRLSKRRRIAKETLDIYAPIANRLGMHSLKVELEDLGFVAMYPMRFRLIRQAVKRIRGNRKDLVRQIQQAITARLQEANLSSYVIGRDKHLYSIYSKMRDQRKALADIMDMFAFRIIVDSVDDSYRALGVIHNFYKPIPGRFKDYIAIPKANGYQSLHTTLFGLHGVPIEVQVRTREMDDMANNGIAAHWQYKSGEHVLSGRHARTQQWLRGVMELQKKAGDSLEFIENVKIDLFPDEIYVFTPKGHIFELPKGATPIDFAYAVHTDIGNTCIACRIDKQLSPLNKPLQSGQTVEIVTAAQPCVNPAWLNFVVTGKARSNIRHLLKNQQRNESILLGRRLLDKALMRFGTSLTVIEPDALQRQTRQLGFQAFDEVFIAIGLGQQMAHGIAKKLAATQGAIAHGQLPTVMPAEMPLAIRGTEGRVVRFAKCCFPIPGDPVVGQVDSGQGIVVHTDTCRHIADIRHNPKKVLPVDWDKQVQGEFTVELHIALEQHRTMIAAIATSVTAVEATIEKISMEERNASFCRAQLLVNVRDRLHLSRVIKRLRAIRGVHAILRPRET